MIKNGKTISNILISLGFVFNLFVFAPLEFYAINIFDFWFNIKNIIPIIIIVSVIAFLILFFILQKVNDKKRIIISKIIFGLFLCLYIQGNYLNIGYGKLDGNEINWKNTILKGIKNSIIWIIVFSLPFAIKPLKKEEKFNIVSSVTTIFIILIEIITLICIMYGEHFDSFEQEYKISKNCYLDESKLFSMSDKENIIYIVADSIESDMVKNALDQCPQLKETLSDFTFFDNATGVSWLTYMSFPTMMTGERMKVGEDLQTNINNCFNNSRMYDVLSKEGFKTEIYSDLALLPSTEKKGLITNKVNKSLNINTMSKIKLTSLLYECVFYKYMPHFVKPLFYIDTQNFSKIDNMDTKAYFIDDIKFNNNLIKNGIDTKLKDKSFKIIELDGSHNPHNITTDVKYNNSLEYLSLPDEQRDVNEVIASLKILGNYIEELKKEGVYDNTTIIWTADHGMYNRYNPALMIKRKNENNDKMIENSAPISFIEDLTPTILNIATNSKNYGKDVYDYTENMKRNRKLDILTFSNNTNGKQYLVDSKIILGIDGIASDENNYYIEDEEFANSNKLPEKEYKIGKKLKLNSNNRANQIVLSGISTSGMYQELEVGTTLGTTAKMTLMPEKTDKDVNATIKISEIHNQDQKIIINVNGQKLFETKLKLNQKDVKVSFKIPKKLWNKNKYLKLEYEFPNVEWDGKNNYELEYVTFSAISFESIKFSK